MVVEEVSTGSLPKPPPTPGGGRCGLGSAPKGNSRSPHRYNEEDTGEGPPPTLRVTLEFLDPDDPETISLLPTMDGQPILEDPEETGQGGPWPASAELIWRQHNRVASAQKPKPAPETPAAKTWASLCLPICATPPRQPWNTR